MTIQLTSGTAPTLSIHKTDFLDQAKEGKFWGVPREYFDIEGDTVFLDPELAAKLDWTIDEDNDHILNISAVAQQVTIDDTDLAINPGFFCSYVTPENIKN